MVDRQLDFGASSDWVEETYALNETAVTGVTRVGHGQVVEWALFRAATGQTNGYHVNIVPIVGAAVDTAAGTANLNAK
ncbi:hypothetical protein D3C76_1399870 [compost metagenome]